jgi:hypothetical protein
MKPRLLGLGLSAITVALAIFSFVMVGKIVSLGGPSYQWEYLPPVVLGCLGIAGCAFWAWRVWVTRR